MISDKIKHLLCLVIFLLWGGVQANAQSRKGDRWRHEMSATAAWAVTGLFYPVWEGGSVRALDGYHAGIAYTGYWSEHWGIEAGVAFYTLNNSLEFPGNLSVTTEEQSPAGEWEDYTVTAQQYRETQRLGMLSPHVAVRCLLPITSGYWFYILGGVRVSVPVSATCDAAAATITATTSAPRYEWTGSGTWNASAAYSLWAETGFRWSLGRRAFIEPAMYINYGFMPARRHNTRSNIIPYNTGESDPSSHSLLDLPEFSGNMALLSYGIKISIGWSIKTSRNSGKKVRYLQGIRYQDY